MIDYQEALDELWEAYLKLIGDVPRLDNRFIEYRKYLEELVERAKPKKPLHKHSIKQFGKCPECYMSVNIRQHHRYCGECGQALDWS